jgi:uncharacterized protein YcbK (DUF882 family)
MPAKLAYRNFTRSEFRCKCGKCDSTGHEISDELLDSLQALRTICEFPFIITSGYRCPSHPAEKNKDFVGAHGCGLAVDISASYEEAIQLLKHALNIGLFTGIGVNQRGDRRFIHLDIATDMDVNAPRPHIWTY